MTAPQRHPVPVDWPPSVPAWCQQCEVHWATTARPLCPVCLDIEAKEGQR